MDNIEPQDAKPKRKFGGRQEGAGRPPKFDYDSDAFYDEIYALAMQGATDDEISYSLGEKFGLTLDESLFNLMKNGKYAQWSEEENKRRGERIRRILKSARMRVNQIVRGRYLKAALGGIKIKSKSTVHKKLRIDGHYTEDEEIQTTETETETPPNIPALNMWMTLHDEDWKSRLKGTEDIDPDKVEDAEVGIDICSWIEMETKKK